MAPAIGKDLRAHRSSSAWRCPQRDAGMSRMAHLRQRGLPTLYEYTQSQTQTLVTSREARGIGVCGACSGFVALLRHATRNEPISVSPAAHPIRNRIRIRSRLAAISRRWTSTPIHTDTPHTDNEHLLAPRANSGTEPFQCSA